MALILLLPTVLSAAQVNGVRLWNAPDRTRLVFDVDSPIEHNLFTLHGPERLVIDLSKSQFKKDIDLDNSAFVSQRLDGLRYAQQANGDLRVVLDLKQSVRPKSFLLKPGSQYGHRLVLDIEDLNQNTPKAAVARSAAVKDTARDIIIAVDAGHGGDDPGARGRVLKSQEKNITLAIAKKLKKLIDAEPGMRAILTRSGDYYVGLRKRMVIARNHHADMFVSIHADAFRDTKARGSSVYVLSRRGASSEAARWLAESENASDLVGGISLDDKDDMLASVLLDLSQSATQQVSLAAASRVHRELGHVSRQHGKRIQHAGFVVLKSPDIPSMLVETGFISNPGEERNLNSRSYQQTMARAVLKGVKGYFYEAPPPGTRIASLVRQQRSQRYTTKPGDTLSAIANRHNVSLVSLRRENKLRGDHIRIGQVLKIPNS